MALELGALHMAIRDQGGAEVLNRLRQLDTAAQQTDKSFGRIKAADYFTAMRGQLGQTTSAVQKQVSALSALHAANSLTAADARLATSLQQRLNTSLQQTNLTLEKRGQIAKQIASLNRITAPPTTAVGASGAGGLGAIGGFAIGTAAVVAVSALTRATFDSARAFDDAERAQRKLSATSKSTGISLATLKDITANARTEFQLTQGEAGELASAVARIAGDAGKLEQTGDALRAFLDIGASRGMAAEETLTAVRQALLGLDEGTDKLFGKNPSTLWKEFAESIGTTAGKLTDAQKKQAILDATFREGAKVRGEYQSFLKSAAGTSSLLATAVENTKVAIGGMFEGTRKGLNSGGASLLNWLANAIGGFNELNRKTDEWWANLGNRLLGRTPDPNRLRVGNSIQLLQNGTTRLPGVTIDGSETDAEKIAKVQERLREEALQQRSREISSLEELAKLGLAREDDLKRMAVLEKEITAEVARGNLTLADRAARLKEVIALGDARTTALGGAGAKTSIGTPDLMKRTPGLSPFSTNVTGPFGMAFRLDNAPRISRVPTSAELKAILDREATTRDAAKTAADQMAKALEQAKFEEQMTATLSSMVASSIANGIAQGFANGFSAGGLAEGLQQATANLLQGIGAMAIQIGLNMTILGSLMGWFLANPWAGIAIGAGMVAFGAAIGGRGGQGASGGRSFGGRSFEFQEASTRLLVGDRPLPPAARQRNAAAATMSMPAPLIFPLVNPADPSSQRIITAAVRAGQGRGL